MNRLRCRKVRLVLPGHILGEVPLGERDARHLEQCLACQAEAAGYRTLRKALNEYRDEPVTAPPWFVTRVMSFLDRPIPASSGRARVRVLTAVVVAGLAVAVWGRRRLVS
ncbi:MAG: hypothetical protein WAM81_06735 [Acidimicrobiia bacterium]